MRNKLYKIIDEITLAKSSAESIQHTCSKEKDLKSFFDIVFNENYEYSIPKKFVVETRYVRDGSGVLDWSDLKRKLYQHLIVKHEDEELIVKLLDKYMVEFNQKDVDIILEGLKTRKIKGVNKKIIFELFPEFIKSKVESNV